MMIVCGMLRHCVCVDTGVTSGGFRSVDLRGNRNVSEWRWERNSLREARCAEGGFQWILDSSLHCTGQWFEN